MILTTAQESFIDDGQEQTLFATIYFFSHVNEAQILLMDSTVWIVLCDGSSGCFGDELHSRRNEYFDVLFATLHIQLPLMIQN